MLLLLPDLLNPKKWSEKHRRQILLDNIDHIDLESDSFVLMDLVSKKLRYSNFCAVLAGQRVQVNG
jgi:hypothetical protein